MEGGREGVGGGGVEGRRERRRVGKGVWRKGSEERTRRREKLWRGRRGGLWKGGRMRAEEEKEGGRSD